ncbi:MAG: PD40 domain-containing protein [Candidatus Schekmanbacteria bacterium]|nr:PD40 domain-containing protein [Candidatus Schekmanbacteria bacterium]
MKTLLCLATTIFLCTSATAAWGPADPPVGQPIAGLSFDLGWGDPRALPSPINSSGWEDSPFILPSGAELYFGYTRIDAGRLLENNELVDSGPDRPGQNGAPFDIYSARVEGDGWVVEHHPANSPDPGYNEAAIGLDATGAVMVFARFEPNADIFLTIRSGTEWVEPVALPAPINTSCSEDNPHLSADGQTLFFDSDRDDPAGSTCSAAARKIYSTRRVDDGWTTPEPVTGEVSDTVRPWQPFASADLSELYWSAEGPGCDGLACIYRARRNPSGGYLDPQVVVQVSAPQTEGSENAIVVGEVSITQDDQYMTFVFGRYRGGVDWQFDLGIARKTTPPVPAAEAWAYAALFGLAAAAFLRIRTFSGPVAGRQPRSFRISPWARSRPARTERGTSALRRARI